MKKLSKIIGHEQNIKHLEKAIATKQISHAYIFHGEDGSGKMTTAKAFVEALLCVSHDGCGMCQSCIQMESGNHPDVIYVTHEKANITVDDIRTQINHTIAVKPYSSEYKVYIIEDADKMNVAAQNALLKTMEEPPEYVILILLADNKDAFLETIVSRSVVLNFGPVPEERVREFIRKQYGPANDQEDLAVAYSMGNIGKAISVMESEEFHEMKEYCINLMTHIQNLNDYEIVGKVKQIVAYKDQISEFLDLMQIYYRDILLLKVTGLPNQIIFKDRCVTMKKQSIYLSFEGIEIISNEIQKAKERLKANVNFEVTMELLLFVMKENGEKW